MFDTSLPINYEQQSIKGKVDKTARLRFPSDEEFIKRQSARKLVSVDLGNGKSELHPPEDAEEIDFELFKKIRLDTEESGADDFDEYEASEAIERILSAEVVKINDAHEDGIAVEIKTKWGNFTHIVTVPTRKQLAVFRKAQARAISGRHNTSILILNVAASQKLYQDIKVRAEGYEGDPPLFHTAAVVHEVNLHIQGIADGSSAEVF